MTLADQFRIEKLAIRNLRLNGKIIGQANSSINYTYLVIISFSLNNFDKLHGKNKLNMEAAKCYYN